MSPGSWFPCFTTCPPSNPFSLFLEIVLMRDLGDGPRGVAVFLFLSMLSHLVSTIIGTTFGLRLGNLIG
jgi:hypothetical protein